MSDRTADTCEEVSVKVKAKARPAVTVITCSRGAKVYCSTGCGRRAEKSCSFALRGKLEGKTCDAPLCDRCMSAHGHCPPHARVK